MSSHLHSTDLDVCMCMCVCVCVCVLPLLCLAGVHVLQSAHKCQHRHGKQSKEQADPNPIPLMNMYHSKNPDPYLFDVILNSAVTIPPPPTFSTPRSMLCIYKLINLLRFKSTSTSENLFRKIFFVLASVEKPFQVSCDFFLRCFRENYSLIALEGKQ